MRSGPSRRAKPKMPIDSTALHKRRRSSLRPERGRPPLQLDTTGAEGWHSRRNRPWTSRHLPQLSLHTPIGDLTVSEEDGHIVAVDWGWGRDQTPTPLLVETRTRLHAYFDGELTSFDLPLAPSGTAYQLRVWTSLRDIPTGETRSYAELARLAGGSPRSVGMANGANPIPIIIPCHRVVGINGPGGYSGGDGLSTKLFLLDLEGASAAVQAQRSLPSSA